MVSSGPNREVQPIAWLNHGVGRKSRHMRAACKREVANRFVAHVFHDVQRHRSQPIACFLGQ